MLLLLKFAAGDLLAVEQALINALHSSSFMGQFR